MSRLVPTPRLLPLTIAVIGALLAMKTVSLGRMALSPGSSGQGLVPAAQAATSEKAAPEPAKAEPAKAEVAKPEIVKPEMAKPGAASPAPPAGVASVSPAQQAAPAAELGEGERALLTELRARRRELDDRDSATGVREGVVAAAEQRLTARVLELEALQARLEGLDHARQSRDEANWKGLVKTYEQMKPTQAAAIFNDLDPTILLPVLDRMAERKAAPVLAAMLPDRARQATADLAKLRTQANTPAAAP